MPRVARIVVPGWPHHVVQRGNNRQDVFFVDDDRQWKPGRWRNALQARDDEDVARLIRTSTHTGRPLATDSILSKLEHKLGRRLRPLPVGRPTKPAKRSTGKREQAQK